MKKKIIACAVIAGALLAAIGYGYQHRYAASIGIIGGADGPTAIFIAGKTGVMFYAGLLLAALAAAAMWRLVRRKKGGGRDEQA